MSITTLTSREFNQDASRAKKAALAGPVYITDRGKPAHVLLSFEDYRRLIGAPVRIAELLAMPAASDLELELDLLDLPARSDLPRAADLD